MAGVVQVPRRLFPLDMRRACRNWIRDPLGNNYAGSNTAAALEMLNAGVNHLLSNRVRVVFNQCFGGPGINTNDVLPTSKSPLYAYLVPDDVDNARFRQMRALTIPPAANSGDQYLQRTTYSGGSWTVDSATIGPKRQLAAVDATAVYPAEAFADQVTYSRGDVTNTEVQEGIATFSDYPLMDCCVQETPDFTLNPDLQTICLGSAPRSGQEIYDNAIDRIRSVFDDLRMSQSIMVGCYSAVGDGAGGDGFGTSGSDPGAGAISATLNGIWCRVTTLTNLIDQSSTSRTADTPGVTYHGYRSGVGYVGVESGKKIPVQCRVFAEASDGTVRFEGPDFLANNFVDIAVDGGAGAAWYGDSDDVIYLDSSQLDTALGTKANKIDISGKVADSANALKVFGWYLFIKWD